MNYLNSDYNTLCNIKKDFVLRKKRVFKLDTLTNKFIPAISDKFYALYNTREASVIPYLTPDRAFDKVILTKWNGKTDLDWKETNYELL